MALDAAERRADAKQNALEEQLRAEHDAARLHMERSQAEEVSRIEAEGRASSQSAVAEVKEALLTDHRAEVEALKTLHAAKIASAETGERAANLATEQRVLASRRASCVAELAGRLRAVMLRRAQRLLARRFHRLRRHRVHQGCRHRVVVALVRQESRRRMRRGLHAWRIGTVQDVAKEVGFPLLLFSPIHPSATPMHVLH